jgi:NAD(P)-dependent dehydrogenase (short-subunit alcohol dehydrogenase family)
MDVNGSVALVTGGQRGIGRAIAAELLSRGATKVYVTARTPSVERDPRLVPIGLDVRDDTAVSRLAGAASDATIVVDDAGVDLVADPFTDDMGAIRDEFDVSVLGLLAVTRTMAPVLAANGGGAILNLLPSLSGAALGDGGSAGAAAARSISTGTRARVAASGTAVTSVHLGRVDPGSTAGTGIPGLSTAEVAARAVDGLVAGDGEVLVDDVGHPSGRPLTGAPVDLGVRR